MAFVQLVSVFLKPGSVFFESLFITSLGSRGFN